MRQPARRPASNAATGTRRRTPSSMRSFDCSRKKHPQRKGPRLHAVRRHGALPGRRSCAHAASSGMAGVTGDDEDPTRLAWRFSPVSNNKREHVPPDEELRVLIATDVLSEGQNLQDGAIVVNYDLPWAIIRLDPASRPRRPHRPASGEDPLLLVPPGRRRRAIIRLRARVRQRLQENAEVVGTDEAFFEDEQNDQKLLDLYNEKAGILDGDAIPKSTSPPMPIRSGRTPSTVIPSCKRSIPALPRWSSIRRRPHEAQLSKACTGCWSISAPPRATTRWRGWTRHGNNVTESPVRHS